MGKGMAAETVTLLFTDLVASTELLSRVGEVAADDLRREHFALLRAAIAEHGGREIKNLGDGLMVVFDGVTVAVATAVSMQQAIASRPASGEPLSIRVGIASGEADVDDGDYFGLPVVEAARLCAKAQGGEILATAMVRMLGRSRVTAEFESVGELQLKGLDEPVETWRVRWVPAPVTTERPALPTRIASSVIPNFVGRTDERQRLDATWKSVVAGDCRVMLLAGEPGIGKTTLSAQFASDTYEDGALVVYGRCDEDLGIPYQPWIEALSQLVAHTPESVLAAHVTERGAQLARLVPELTRRLGVHAPSADSDASERYVLFGCVTDLLARISADTPVLLVLDDLHWADPATAQLFRHLATADAEMRVGILATFRDSEVSADHPITGLLTALHREGNGIRFDLRGLGDDDLLDLLERIAGHDMDDAGVALRDAILAETAGNPFFVGELVRHLAETGAIYQNTDGRWVSETEVRSFGLPVSVREVIGRRVAALGAETQRALALGAVIGRDFNLPVLAKVADIDEDRLIDLCDAAVAASVLQETDDPECYTFAHALIEHALYDGLSPARRARAHRNVAIAIEDQPDSNTRIGELAHHWSLGATPADSQKALHYAALAGRRALDQLAPDEALQWCRQARELADRNDDVSPRARAELLLVLAQAEKQCGIAEHRDHFVEVGHLAEQIGAVDLMVEAALKDSRGWSSRLGDVDTARTNAIERALGAVGTTDPIAHARLLALLAVELRWDDDPERRRRLAEEAVATARQSGDQTALVESLYSSTLVYQMPSTLRDRISALEEALTLADEIANPMLTWYIILERTLTAFEDADFARIQSLEPRGRAIEARFMSADNRWLSKCHEVWSSMLHGTTAEADHLVEAALQIGLDAGQPDAFAMYAAQIVGVRFNQGRWSECLNVIEAAIADIPGLGVYQAVLAMAHARGGDRRRAETLLDEVMSAEFDLPEGLGWSTGMAALAETAVLLRRQDVARYLRTILEPFHGQIVTTTVTFDSPFAYYLGRLDELLGHFDEAEAWFNESLTISRSVESPLLVAYTEAAWAQLSAECGDIERAKTLAESALAKAIPGGFGGIEIDARAVLEKLTDAPPT